MSKPKDKKGDKPSNEEAELAMDMIKILQKKGDEKSKIEKEQEEENARRKAAAELEKARIELAQEQVRRKLRENLEKKEKEKAKSGAIKLLEMSTDKKSKIKWKSINNGNTLYGYIEKKLVFEIKRSPMLFSLYIKDKELLEKKKTKQYQGCSMSIDFLKRKSDKLI